jgi:hypothetical protein
MTVDLRNEAACDRDERRAAVREHPTLNGIDFVEYFEQLAPPPATFWLIVTFLKNAPALVGQKDKFTVTGGTRIVGVEIVDVKAVAGHPEQLEVDLSEVGDFSTYMLAIDDPSLDVQLSSIEFHFRPGCPTPFDCRPVDDCPPEQLDEPVIDYLAKDYASFRRLLLDLAAQRNPGWKERNPADVGVMLVELLAYFGDRLSYFQDAVATEAFLDTCRRRVSAKRHVRLIDYHMHDGRNAWTHAHLQAGGPGTVPRGTRLMTRIAQPLRGKTSPPATLIPAIDLDFDGDPVLRGVTVFETTAQMDVDPINNLLTIHAWSDEECCLPAGTTSVSLYAVSAGFAVRPHLQPGDLLLFEEVKGRETGAAPDADPTRRQVVRLTDVADAEDPVYTDAFAPDGALQPAGAGDPALLLQHVRWSEAEALRMPLCLSARYPETGLISGISVARGNVVPCDHGRTIREDVPIVSSSPASVTLPRAPLTFQSNAPVIAGTPHLDADRFDLVTPVDQAEPAVELELSLSSGDTEVWLPVPDLLDDNAFATHFVVDVGDEGDATLRFGDDEYGQHPDNVVQIAARYRIGNGLAGNIGSGSLVHVSPPSPAVILPAIGSVWQATAAAGGVAPQTIEEVRQLAPAAFRAEQFRAVTEGDYEAAALKVAGVAAAKCVFRWTGSWRTVFVAIHPADPANLITLPTGENELRSDLADAVAAKLRRYKLAGYDLEIRAARYVPLLIEMRICVAHGYFRGDVLLSVTHVLSNRRYADGTVGFFHPTRFHFGQSVYLSRIYEAVQSVTGVDSVEVMTFQRYWSVANGELASGEIALADDEIARLDNDRNFAENGVLHLTAVGGS